MAETDVKTEKKAETDVKTEKKKVGKTVVVRIYASYDADLVWLCEQGVSIAPFAKSVLTDYTYGKEVRYTIPPSDTKCSKNIKTFRTRIVITDPNVIKVLDSIRPRRINLFIKTLLRNALARQNMGAFFLDDDDSEYISKEKNINVELSGEGYSPIPVRSRKNAIFGNVSEGITEDNVSEKEETIQNTEKNAVLEFKKVSSPEEAAPDVAPITNTSEQKVVPITNTSEQKSVNDDEMIPRFEDETNTSLPKEYRGEMVSGDEVSVLNDFISLGEDY